VTLLPGHSRPAPARWRASSLALIAAFWAVLQLGGIFSPGLLDDVDSVYLQIAREMLHRHDFVTPTIDGIRFFDKPPLMYWLAAASMRLFGEHDWAARIPLALGVLALLFAVYALGNRLFAAVSPAHARDRAGLYAAIAMATSIGPYLYTRFYIPDILIALWMTLAVHLFLIAVDRTTTVSAQKRVPHISPHEMWAESPQSPGAPFMARSSRHERGSDALLPMLGFAATLALSVLTKGLIGIVFPLAFAFLYLALTRNLRLLAKLHLLASTAVFLLIAAPWHILAALRNPAIAMPAGNGLPTHAGWSWFYLYNEHVARFLGRRIPHDYGQVPIPLFWALLILWLVPWAAFLPFALKDAITSLRATMAGAPFMARTSRHERGEDAHAPINLHPEQSVTDRSHEAALALLLWAGIILGFFTLSSRQEYYHLPALPALALLVAGLLASADRAALLPEAATHRLPALFGLPGQTRAQALRGALWFLVPFGTLLFLICGYLAIASPRPPSGATLHQLLSTNPDLYNLSLGHVFDLTGQAMGFFRGPLLTVALGMLALGPIAYVIRRRGHPFRANLLIAAGMTAVLLAAHQGLVRFNPILGSKDLALAINSVKQPGDILVLDGELTGGSTLLFYSAAPGERLYLVNGRINGPWFGSFWPDAPHIFLTDADLLHLWSGPHRVFLLTYQPTQRKPFLTPAAPVHDFADSGGKSILTNR
jgi:4-amino-4-deoxy-L-arabinose transferase-like glycosyltransferase